MLYRCATTTAQPSLRNLKVLEEQQPTKNKRIVFLRLKHPFIRLHLNVPNFKEKILIYAAAASVGVYISVGIGVVVGIGVDVGGGVGVGRRVSSRPR